MPNAEEFSELIRTGGLDFALLKPIDTQFLISLQRIEWSALANFLFGVGAAGVLAVQADDAARPDAASTGPALYPFYVLCGVAILYSLMIAWRPPASGWGAIRRCTTSGSTSPTSPATRWRSTAAARRSAAGVLHVRHSGAGRGQRAGAAADSALGAADAATGSCPPLPSWPPWAPGLLALGLLGALISYRSASS